MADVILDAADTTEAAGRPKAVMREQEAAGLGS
jgi:hypothetical protein